MANCKQGDWAIITTHPQYFGRAVLCKKIIEHPDKNNVYWEININLEYADSSGKYIGKFPIIIDSALMPISGYVPTELDLENDKP